MKKSSKIFITLISVFASSSILTSFFFGKANKKNANRSNEVVVYTYDSFAGEWGPGPELQKRFEEKTGLKLTLVDCGDAVQALSRAILEKQNTQADVIVGIDNNTAVRAKKENILTPYESVNADCIDNSLKEAVGGDSLLTPYDYSHFAIIYDTAASIPAPKSLADLTKKIYEKKLILMDPRTSTPGLGFVAWTVAIYGDKYIDYWKELKPSILTMAAGWTAGYGLFTNGEAPLVISYTTSPAYHYEEDKSTRFKTLVFEQGHSEQVEAAGLLKNAPNAEGGKAFIDFLISEEGQNTLPLTQWMYPANKNVKVPESYTIAAPIPSKTVSASIDDINTAVENIMKILSE